MAAGLAPGQNPLVEGVILGRHPGGTEALLHRLAASAAVDLADLPDPDDGLVGRRDQKPGAPVLDQLGHRAAVDRDHRRAAGHRLDHGQAERLVEPDQVEQRRRIAQRMEPLRPADRTVVEDLHAVHFG